MTKIKMLLQSLTLVLLGSVTLLASTNSTSSTKEAIAIKDTQASSKVHLQKGPAGNASTNAVPPGPEVATIGLYLFNIRDVSSGRGTFTSDFCIWSHSEGTGNIISELQFANAERVVWAVEGRPEVKGLNCIKRCGTGTFRMKWDLHNYPYDVQNLHILINYTLKDSSKVVIVPDQTNSGISKSNLPQGWALKSFTLEPKTIETDSNLGDPNLGGAHGTFSGIDVTIGIERTETTEYWEMILIAYSTAFLFLVSFFIDLSNTSRYGLLGAGFIACVISLRTSVSVLGVFGTRVDQLHFIVMGYLAFAVLCTAILNYLVHHKVKPDVVRNASMVIGVLTMASFIFVNWLLHVW